MSREPLPPLVALLGFGFEVWAAAPEPASFGLFVLGLVLAGCRPAIRVARTLPTAIIAPLAVASLLGWSAPASADIITISSESFALGIDVSHALTFVQIHA